jgi:uncharacterized protein YdhG (YjbR/CyaY superfamily)
VLPGSSSMLQQPRPRGPRFRWCCCASSCSIAHMKKAKSVKHGGAAKNNSAPKTVDEYLDAIPEPARSTLDTIRATIRAAAPPESIEIISYGMPGFKHGEVLMWYAGFAKHCSLFPSAAVIEAFKKELKGFVISKGTIQFTTDKPLPAALVKKMVKARVAHIKSQKRR